MNWILLQDIDSDMSNNSLGGLHFLHIKMGLKRKGSKMRRGEKRRREKKEKQEEEEKY